MGLGASKKCFGWHELANGDVIHYYFEGSSLQEMEYQRSKNNKARKHIEGGIFNVMKQMKIEVEKFINNWSENEQRN